MTFGQNNLKRDDTLDSNWDIEDDVKKSSQDIAFE
jgi:hypothetical protein